MPGQDIAERLDRLESLLEPLAQGDLLVQRLAEVQKESTHQIEEALRQHTKTIVEQHRFCFKSPNPPELALILDDSGATSAGSHSASYSPTTPVSESAFTPSTPKRASEKILRFGDRCSEVGEGRDAVVKSMADLEEGACSMSCEMFDRKGPKWDAAERHDSLAPSRVVDWPKPERRKKPTLSDQLVRRGAGRGCLLRMVRKLKEWKRYSQEPGKPTGYEPCTKFFWKRLSKPFDALCMAVVLINAAFVVRTANQEIREPGAENSATFVEWSFTAFYTAELCVRIVTERGYFFFGPSKWWHFFDAALITVSLFSDSNIGFLRSLRVLRVAKVVRAIKLLHFNKILKSEALEVMINCLTGSLHMLFWCVLMIVLFAFIFSVFLVQIAAEYLGQAAREGIAVDESSIDEFRYWFGSVETGMLTLLMATTGGANWIDIHQALCLAGWVAQALLVFFILWFTMAVWNVVTSTFVDKALKLAKASDDTVISELKLQAERDTRDLDMFFRKLDIDGNGRLDFDEFAECMRKPDLERWLQTRGIDIKETKMFFNMLAGNESTVDIDTIVQACIRMRGFATSIDLHTLRYELRRIQKTILTHHAAGT